MRNLLLVHLDKDLVEALAVLTHSLLMEIHLHDCTLFTACASHEAIEIVERQPIDLLLADYDLPEMNGLDLIRTVHIRGWKNIARIITARACMMDHLIDISRGYGVDMVVRTPIQREELKQLLRRFLIGDSWMARKGAGN